MYINLKNIKNRIFGTIFAAIIFFSIFNTTAISVKSEDVPEREPQDVRGVLNATMQQLADTVKEPTFGTFAGEWTVLCLARGEYYKKDNVYFSDYYNRIVEYVNTKVASVNLNGALHKSKSTDNSRVILALSSIGKDATTVGDCNLITPYDDFNWIKKQGINGVIFTLIALDTGNYQTTDITIRQQCVDFILNKQLSDGGWALSGAIADPDITGMALQSLYPYREQSKVSTAAESAFTCLSNIQKEDGGFASWGTVNSESCAQVIVALATWGINPDTDSRFIKNGNSVIDNLLTYYVEKDAMFMHVLAGESNAMATDQACYALVAYNRFLNGKTSLYDMSDVTIEDDNNGDNSENNDDENGNIDTNIPDTPNNPDDTTEEALNNDAETTDKNEEINIPQTAEDSYIIFYGILLSTSICGLVYSLRILKKGGIR